jgi:hypothetical protein
VELNGSIPFHPIPKPNTPPWNVLILHTARGGTVAGPYCMYVAALIFTLYTADRSGARPVRAAK